MEGNEDHSAMSMEDAIAASGGQVEVQESTEQQAPEETQTTEATEATEETQESSSETQEQGETETTEAEETTEETTEASEGSKIIDLISEEESTEEQETTDSSENQEQSTNFSEMLNGEFKNEEDLGNYLESQNALIEELRQANEPEFANETVQKLNEYVMNGGTAADFMKVQGVNVDTMSPVDTLVTELKWNNPNLTESQAREHIQDKYGLDDGDDGSSNTSAVIASNEAGSKIRSLQADDSPVQSAGMSEEEWNEKFSKSQEAENEALMQQDDARMSDWQTPINNTINNLKEKGIVVNIGNGKGFQYDFNADETYVKSLVDQAEQALFMSGTTVKDSPELAKQMIEMQFKNDNFDEIIKAYGHQVANSKNEEWFKQTHNPSVVSRGNAAPKETNALPSAEEEMNRVMGM